MPSATVAARRPEERMGRVLSFLCLEGRRLGRAAIQRRMVSMAEAGSGPPTSGICTRAPAPTLLALEHQRVLLTNAPLELRPPSRDSARVYHAATAVTG